MRCVFVLGSHFRCWFQRRLLLLLVGGEEEKNMFCIHSRPKKVVLVCAASGWGVSTSECRSTKRGTSPQLLATYKCRLLFSPLGDTSMMSLAFLQTQQQSTPHLRVGHHRLFQISMKLPLAKIIHKVSFSGLKMRLAGLWKPQKWTYWLFMQPCFLYRLSLSTFQRVFSLKHDSRVFGTRYRVLMEPKQMEIVGCRFSLLLPLVNFKAVFLKTG